MGSETCDLLLTGGRLVTPEGVLRADLAVRDGCISLGPGRRFRPGSTIDVGGCYVLPGFVDIHFHGYNLFEFSAGRYDPQRGGFDDSAAAYDQGFAMLRRTLPRFGVTGFYVASWAAPVESLKKCFGHLARALQIAPAALPPGARLLGGLLEGTFINPAMAGAQNPAFVMQPSVRTFEAIEDSGSIRLANVVPDWGEPSVELIRCLSSRGIVVGAGHTAATAQQVRQAVAAGLRYFIHFLNGPTGSSFKPFDGGGAVEAGLSLDEPFLELILDGYHVNPRYVRDVLARVGFDRAVAVTDALYVAGSEMREISIGGTRGRVSDDGTHIYVVGKPNTLCSSNLTMDRAFRNLLNWLTVEMEGVWVRRHRALDFEEALGAAAKLCAANACRLTGLAGSGLGAIREGAPADLAVVRIAGEPGRYTLAVERTLVAGASIPPQPSVRSAPGGQSSASPK